MQRFLRYKSGNYNRVVEWLGSVADGGIIEDKNGELLEQVVNVESFQILQVADGYLGVLLVDTEKMDTKEVNTEEVDNG